MTLDGMGGFKGTITQSDGLEDLGDECTGEMRSQAGFVV